MITPLHKCLIDNNSSMDFTIKKVMIYQISGKKSADMKKHLYMGYFIEEIYVSNSN